MQSFDTTIWIVHRDPGPRGALGRLAGATRGRHEIVLGRPGDSVFDAATPADVIVLDVSTSLADPEPELDLARRVRRTNPDCAWILVTEPGMLQTTLRLFDALDARVIAGPPDARTLQAAIAAALARTRILPLSQRIGRDQLSARFVRWFSAGEPRELALAVDPRLSAEPVLARGETGTGRGLLLRYVHATASAEPGPFVRVACGSGPRPDELIAQIEDGLQEAGGAGGCVGLWLDEIDCLDDAVQARVLDWIEFGPPASLPFGLRGKVRWFASAGEDPSRLDARLALSFAELTICTVPLRAHAEIIPAFVADTARAWAAARRESPKTFDPPAVDLLRSEPWPGNLAELEAVVIRTLAHADPRATHIRISDLRFGPEVEPAATSWSDARARDRGPGASGAEDDEEAVVFLEPETEAPEALEVIDLELSPILETPEDAKDAAAAPAQEPDEQPAREPEGESIARLAKAVAHEVRNPLVSIRTFSDLLHDHYADEEFRDRFGRLVADDVRRIEQVVERLEQMGQSDAPPPAIRVDMTALLENLLDEQRAHIQSKRLLVLKELDRARPEAIGDEGVLRTALAGLLDRAIEEVPERGDLYLASRHRAESTGGASIRIVVRYRVAEAASDSDLALETLRDTSLAAEVAESMIERQGGSLRIDTSNPAETVVTIDLPAPTAHP